MPSTTFLPSVHGWKFVNSWNTPPSMLAIASRYGTIPEKGLCAGMCLGAGQYWSQGRQVPAANVQPTGALFNYLIAKQFDANGINDGWSLIQWARRIQLASDRDIEAETRRVAQRIMSAVRNNSVSFLCVYDGDVSGTSQHGTHANLCYGFDAGAAGIRFKVYDPNLPLNDNTFIYVSHDAKTILRSPDLGWRIESFTDQYLAIAAISSNANAEFLGELTNANPETSPFVMRQMNQLRDGSEKISSF